MKTIGLFALIFCATIGFAQPTETPKDTDGCPIFEMAEGDTVFTMKQYFFVLLKTGENRDQNEAKKMEIQEGHMAHINKMAEDGYLSIAGPFGHDGEYRGILIFNVPTEKETRALVEQDPAFKSGRLSYEVYPWWGAKGSRLK